MKEWIRVALITAACLFIWFAGHRAGAESVTFQSFCEQSGGRMESATACVVPQNNPPPTEAPTLGA